MSADAEPAHFAAVTVCVFDAYGTLFDVHTAVARCRNEIGPVADALSMTWRLRQVEYSWLRSLMGHYADFWQVTGEALDYAMAVHGLDDAALRAHLMELYLRLDAYPEVPEVLGVLHGRGLKTAILSNGSPTMLTAAVNSARLRGHLDAILSADRLQVYKPHPSVYQMACDQLGVDKGQVLFLSSNGWDVAGAAAFGFRVVWVNRAGQPRERLPVGPNAEVGSLTDLPGLIE